MRIQILGDYALGIDFHSMNAKTEKGNRKAATRESYGFEKMVGASRFERPTTRTPSEYATRLRHAPILYALMTYFSSSNISRTSFFAVSMTASASCRPLPLSFFRAPEMVYPF